MKHPVTLMYCCGCGVRLREKQTAKILVDEDDPRAEGWESSWQEAKDGSVFTLWCPTCAALGPQPSPLKVRMRMRFSCLWNWLHDEIFGRLP